MLSCTPCILIDCRRVTYITFRILAVRYTIITQSILKCIPIILLKHILYTNRSRYEKPSHEKKKMKKKNYKTTRILLLLFDFCCLHDGVCISHYKKTYRIWNTLIHKANKSLTTSSFVIYFTSGL